MSAAEGELLFVYGSLKRGFVNHGVLRGAEPRGEGRTSADYRLVQIDAYPALATSGSRSIAGELYWVPVSLLGELDAFEGEEYVRAPVTLADGSQAQAYFIADHALRRAEPLEMDVWIGYGACSDSLP